MTIRARVAAVTLAATLVAFAPASALGAVGGRGPARPDRLEHRRDGDGVRPSGRRRPVRLAEHHLRLHVRDVADGRRQPPARPALRLRGHDLAASSASRSTPRCGSSSLQSRDFKLLFHVDPGLKLYTTSSAQFGFQFPVGLVMGFPVQPNLEIGVGLDFNMTLLVSGNSRPAVHLRAGGRAVRRVPPHARPRRWPQHPLRRRHRRLLVLRGNPRRDEHRVRLHDTALPGVPLALAGDPPRPAPTPERTAPGPPPIRPFLDKGGGFR